MSTFRTFIQDLRYGLRLFARNPAITMIAAFTLAIGIGANVALFSVVNAVLLRGLPFRDPGRLVLLHETHPEVPKFGLSYPNYEDWRQQAATFPSSRQRDGPCELIHR